MKVPLAGNLKATAVPCEQKWFSAIDDGGETYYFPNPIFGGKGNAVAHAQNVLDDLQAHVNTYVSGWRLVKKD